tara:strand:+ start:1167 stop:1592 length:426 start_codon:yes stop_codon:yes gene_type:complete
MSRYFSKAISTIIFIILGFQILIYYYNTKPSAKVFSQKSISVENFSSIVLGSSGMTKIGSEKLNKIDDENIYLEGKSYLENTDYRIYGHNISIDLENDISESDNNVKVINSMGELQAKGFKNLDYERKIYFEGEVTFIIYD